MQLIKLGGGKLVSTNLLKAKIAELELSNKEIADKLNLSESGWYQKLNGTRSLTIKEMFALQKILKIKDADLKQFFLS